MIDPIHLIPLGCRSINDRDLMIAEKLLEITVEIAEIRGWSNLREILAALRDVLRGVDSITALESLIDAAERMQAQALSREENT